MQSPEEKKILAKIKKLLIMSDGTANVHEAALAMEKAHEMIQRYNVKMAVEIIKGINDDGGSIISVFTGKSYVKNLPQECHEVIFMVKKLFDCEARITRIIDPKSKYGRRKSMLQLFGYATDIEAAKWTYNYLLKQLKSQYLAFTKKDYFLNCSQQIVKDSFIIGFGFEIMKKIRMIKDNEVSTTNQCRELAICKEKAIRKEFGDFKYCNGRTPKRLDRKGLEHGALAGRNTNISRPIEK